MVMTVVIFILYGLLADTVRRYVVDSPKVVVWMQRFFAAPGIKLALTEP